MVIPIDIILIGVFVTNDEGDISFSTIYDCSSCLNPLLEHDEIEQMGANDIKNLALNAYSVLKENGKKIHYVSYIKDLKNKDVCDAILRVYPRISINDINNFIDNIEGISVIRKVFYKKIIGIRYEILESIYNKINN